MSGRAGLLPGEIVMSETLLLRQRRSQEIISYLL